MKRLLLAMGLVLAMPLLTLSTATAEEPAGLSAVPEPPELPPQVESGETLEPEVTIIKSDTATVKQYSINGRVYMVEFIPSSGPPYYMVDQDGDGQLDIVEDDPRNISVPQWVLFSW